MKKQQAPISPTGEFILYQTEDGRTRIEVRMQDETVWLTQKQMAELFGKDTDTIGLHIRNIYKEGELTLEGTTEESSVVQDEGRRRLRRVAQICKNYGQRVQKSVFECQVNEMKFEQLRKRLLKEGRLELDNLRLYRLTEPREKHVEQYRTTQTVFFDEETLVI